MKTGMKTGMKTKMHATNKFGGKAGKKGRDKPREKPKALFGLRLAKRIAASGVASRREAEAMIADGRVSVGGKPLSPQASEATEEGALTLDGSPLPPPQSLQLYLFHKPREVLTARNDPSSRACLPDLLPASLARLKPVGRLDFLSEGLLLLTTSGSLARFCELPQNAWQRCYRLRLHGLLDGTALTRFKELEKGIEIEGVHYRSLRVRVEKSNTSTRETTDKFKDWRGNFWVEVVVREGKNRELRKIMGALGFGVSRLIRTRFGPFGLEGLARGTWRQVREKELRTNELFEAFRASQS